MNCLSPVEILEAATKKGVQKARGSTRELLILAFLGGLYISLGFMGYLRVAGTIPKEWGSFSTFLGACVFPVGLIGVLMAGGELITGNMMVVAVAWFRKQITLGALCRNWILVTIGNLAGALFTAFFLGHVTGITEGAFLAKTLAIAGDKVAQSFFPALVSGIGCNIFVCMAVWLSFGTKEFAGKILAIWFPVMTFVAIGFQHVVANMFIIPAAIFSGESAITWMDFLGNCVPVYIGNTLGGAVVLGLLYCAAYGNELKKAGISEQTTARK